MFPPNIGPFAGTPVNTKKCWKCATREVDEADDLGCCDECIELLRDPDYVAPGWANAVILQVEQERNEALQREMRE